MLAIVLVILGIGAAGTFVVPKHVTINSKAATSTIVNEAPKVIDGVVHVMCPEWQGSGFAVSEHLIVTARHVVEGVEDFVITTNDGHKLHATRAMSMKNHDVGFIYVDDLTCVNEKCERDGVLLGKHQVHLKALKVGSIEECRLGQEVFAIGSPYGKINFNNLTSGIISGLGKDWEEIDPYTSKPYGWSVTWVTSVVGHPGNSGCPIFTLDGKVRGILVGGFSPVLICAMPVDLFAKDLQEIEKIFRVDKYQFEGRTTIKELEYQIQVLRNKINELNSSLIGHDELINELEEKIILLEQRIVELECQLIEEHLDEFSFVLEIN